VTSGHRLGTPGPVAYRNCSEAVAGGAIAGEQPLELDPEKPVVVDATASRGERLDGFV